MSKELYFYRVSKIDKRIPKTINLDETSLEYAYSDENHAAEWEKIIGQRCLIMHRTVDIFTAAEKEFGQRPASMQFQYNDDYNCYDEEGEFLGIMTRKMMEPYYYMDERFAYVYDKESLTTADSGHIVKSAHSGIIGYDELVLWAEEATRYIDEYYSGECYKEPGQALFAVMLAALHVKNGDMVLCEVG